MNLVGRWIQFLANLDTETEFLNKAYAWSGAHTFNGLVYATIRFFSVGEYGYCTAGGVSTTKTRTVLVPLLNQRALTDDGAHWTGHLGGYLGCFTALDVIQIPINPTTVPSGCTLTRVRACVKQAATASIDMKMLVYKSAADTSGPGGTSTLTQLGSEDSAADSGFDILSSGSFSEAIDRSANTYFVEIWASDAVGPDDAFHPDEIHWVELQFSDPGPRNG
jgi:hypothetical protein